MISDKFILISNDDGVRSQGIKVLAKEASKFASVYVVAPENEQSAKSHSLTIGRSLTITELESEENIKWFSIDGTPVDCVKLGISKILPRKPDFVLSGINHGANIGPDVLYSGTIGAAMEGLRHECPSLAFSSCMLSGKCSWKLAALVVHKCLSQVIANKLQFQTVLNINIPLLQSVKDLKGYQEAVLANMNSYRHSYEEIINIEGVKSYKLAPSLKKQNCEEGTDLKLVQQGYVTISPLDLDVFDTNFDSKIFDYFKL